MLRRLPILAVLVAGCDRTTLFDMNVTYEPIAVGATVLGQLQSQSCSGADCDLATVTILSMEVSPPGVFAPPQPGDRSDNFRIAALAEGTATLTVTGTDGDETRTFTRDLTAVIPNRVTGELAYQKLPCTAPALYGPGVVVELPFEIWRDEQKVYSYGLVPFASTGLPIDEDLSQAGTLQFKLPTGPTTVQVTSTLDAAFAASFEVISPSAIDGITLGPPDEPLQILDEAVLHVDLLAGGAVVCGDAISRTARTLTPDVCKINGPTPRDEWIDAGIREVSVVGRKGGTCTITITNAITGPSATTSFQVTM